MRDNGFGKLMRVKRPDFKRAAGGWAAAFMRLSPRARLIASLTLVVAGLVGFTAWHQHQLYNLSPNEIKLIGTASIDQKFVKVQDGTISYNHGESTYGKKQSVTVSSGVDATGQAPYMATLSRQPGGGMTFSDAKKERQFRLIPQFDTEVGKYDEGRVVYPEGLGSSHVYTFKKNGIKEDIILSRVPKGGVATYSWKLDLGPELEARLMPDGAVGIFSANPYLFGNLQISDDKSKGLIEKARKNGKKEHLAFVLPAPYLIDAAKQKNYKDVSFKLEGDKLTLTARNLEHQKYPLSIDPSVVVTTTADFKGGSDEGMIDYGTADQINQRAPNTPSTG
ncbi:MAG TPA: hypothetical protein VK983_04650, partial [Candidatus Limnocylindrales bacterium]|nr:hypothetical protein [Candidatus Limnocylindrales bacterium]